MPSISPGSGSGSGSGTVQQFLTTVLSRPNVVPYQEDVKFSIREHLVRVIQSFPGLQARTSLYTFNDGRQLTLLQADGTIPMYYQDVKYNIPVTIWLLESYPRKPPLVYVTPTRDMIIKPRHPFVDASGVVAIPYLQQWLFPRSNLVELVQNLSLHFGQDPPLYSRPAVPLPSQFQGMNPIYTPPTSTTPPGPYPPYFPQQTAQRTEDPFKKNAVNSLTARLQQDMVALRSSFEVEMDELFTVQAVLNQRSEQLGKLVEDLTREKEGLEQQLQLLLTNTDVLETWLKSNDRYDCGYEVGDEEAFEPWDVLSKQMLECSEEDLAIEDVLYSLDKAVQEGVIGTDSYLKHVRMLAREQFFHRATSAKVRTAQMQAQVAGMAARGTSA